MNFPGLPEIDSEAAHTTKNSALLSSGPVPGDGLDTSKIGPRPWGANMSPHRLLMDNFKAPQNIKAKLDSNPFQQLHQASQNGQSSTVSPTW